MFVPGAMEVSKKITYFLILHVKKLFELNAAVGVGTEHPLLLHLRRLGGVSDDFIISLT